jgi:hypothetical protein
VRIGNGQLPVIGLAGTKVDIPGQYGRKSIVLDRRTARIVDIIGGVRNGIDIVDGNRRGVVGQGCNVGIIVIARLAGRPGAADEESECVIIG